MCFCSNEVNCAYLTTNTSTLHVHLSVYHFVYVYISPKKWITLNLQCLHVHTE